MSDDGMNFMLSHPNAVRALQRAGDKVILDAISEMHKQDKIEKSNHRKGPKVHRGEFK